MTGQTSKYTSARALTQGRCVPSLLSNPNYANGDEISNDFANRNDYLDVEEIGNAGIHNTTNTARTPTGIKKTLVPWNNGMISLQGMQPSAKIDDGERFGSSMMMDNESRSSYKSPASHSSKLIQLPSSSIEFMQGYYTTNRTEYDGPEEQNVSYDDDEEMKLLEYRQLLLQRKRKWKNRIQRLHKKIEYQQNQFDEYYYYQQQQQDEKQVRMVQQKQQQRYKQNLPKYYHDHNSINDMSNNNEIDNDNEMVMMMMMEEEMMDTSNFIDPFE
jgi:hypothetical protein